MFSACKKCTSLDVAKSKQEVYSKFLPQELTILEFSKGLRTSSQFLGRGLFVLLFSYTPSTALEQASVLSALKILSKFYLSWIK